jgi:uncharacterized membrane protein
MDVNELLPLVLRWMHFLAGITWIGLLYFFNLINVNFQKALDADTKKKVNPELLLRALFWFRWGAMFTLLTGLGIIWWKYFYLGSGFSGPSGMMTTPGGLWITVAGSFGIVMWFNVWFIIWPAQKKILGAALGTNPPPDAAIPKRAMFASKMNTWLSVPMLFGMGAGGGHITTFSWPLLLIVVAVGFLTAHLFITMAGPAVKPTV